MNIKDKKVSVDNLLKNIAHQWRQPLSQINSNVFAIDEVLYELDIHDKRIEERLLEIEKLTAYLSKIIDDFRVEKRTVFSIKELLDEVYTTMEPTLKDKQVDLIVNTKVDFSYSGNERELFHVIIVLVNNAKDALVERNVYLPKINIVAKEEEESYIIEIKDNAGGMTQKVIEKIFEKEFSTKHSSEGSGIGLSMAKSIILEKFSGDLSVKNLDEGSCFEIKLKA